MSTMLSGGRTVSTMRGGGTTVPRGGMTVSTYTMPRGKMTVSTYERGKDHVYIHHAIHCTPYTIHHAESGNDHIYHTEQ